MCCKRTSFACVCVVPAAAAVHQVHAPPALPHHLQQHEMPNIVNIESISNHKKHRMKQLLQQRPEAWTSGSATLSAAAAAV
jgi:hypothetical protein